MRAGDIVSVGIVALVGGAAGMALGGTLFAVALAAGTGALGYGATRANIRPGVFVTVLSASVVGGFIGSRVVEAICLPQTCSSIEITGGIVVAILIFAGVGLLTALVARSFDEYNERESAGVPPTEVGCEVPEAEEE